MSFKHEHGQIMNKICEKYSMPQLYTLDRLLAEEQAIHIQESIIRHNRPFDMTKSYFYLALGRIQDEYKRLKE